MPSKKTANNNIDHKKQNHDPKRAEEALREFPHRAQTLGGGAARERRPFQKDR
jgi:hypothetical protein